MIEESVRTQMNNVTSSNIRVLIIEDSDEYANVIEVLLAGSSGVQFESERFDQLSLGLQRLLEGGIDVVLLDLSVRDSRGLQTFNHAHSEAPNVPIIVLTGTDDERVAVEAVRRGAQDYLVKGRIDVPILVRSIRYAIERHRILVEVKQAEETLRESQAKALEALDELKTAQQSLVQAEKLSSLGKLVAGVAHELNNPLYSISGLSQLVLSRDLDKTLRNELEMIHAEAERSVKIVQNLLSFARRDDSGKALISVNLPIQAAVELRRYELEVNNIELEVNLQPDLPWTMAERHQIQQVALNLIINAEQAMLEAHGAGRLVVQTEQAGHMIRWNIRDDGPGIPSEILDQIFDPFFTTKDVGKGSGLGLSICYGIIQEHGGSIHANSEPGHTTFTVELPIVAEEKLGRPGGGAKNAIEDYSVVPYVLGA